MRAGLDLLPETIRVRARTGVRAGWYLVATGLAAVAILVGAIESRWVLHAARERLVDARSEADDVLRMEMRVAALEKSLELAIESRQHYETIAHPLSIGRVLATIANALPEGSTIERIDIEAGPLRAGRAARDRSGAAKDERPPRVLRIEVAGFAPDDNAVAEFLARLDATPPFEWVTLEYSRTRVVRERPAREFRLTIQADLERRYVDAGEGGR